MLIEGIITEITTLNMITVFNLAAGALPKYKLFAAYGTVFRKSATADFTFLLNF